MEQSKRCSVCLTTYPLDGDHFYWDSHKGSFGSACKICRREQSRKLYHRNRTPQPQAEDTRLLNTNYKALERLLSSFYEHGKASAPIQLQGSPEPLKNGIQFYKSCGEGKVRFTTVSGTQTRRLPLISLESLSKTLASFDMRILSHD